MKKNLPLNKTALWSSISVIILLLLLSSKSAEAQKKYNPADYEKKPVWVQMMRDKSANYFETIKAFREFFKDRHLPKEPGEVKGHDAFEKEVGLEEKDDDNKSEEERERELKKQNPNEPDY